MTPERSMINDYADETFGDQNNNAFYQNVFNYQ